jgi:hypothetical protein
MHRQVGAREAEAVAAYERNAVGVGHELDRGQHRSHLVVGGGKGDALDCRAELRRRYLKEGWRAACGVSGREVVRRLYREPGIEATAACLHPLAVRVRRQAHRFGGQAAVMLSSRSVALSWSCALRASNTRVTQTISLRGRSHLAAPRAPMGVTLSSRSRVL